MKNLLLMVLGVASAAVFAEPTVVSVKVSQLWPFEPAVRVDYVLSGVTDPVDVTPTFYDGDVELVSPVKAGDADNYSGDLHRVGNGAHAFTFDPQKVLGGAKKRLALRCKLTLGVSAANMSDVLYRVIDLKTGAIEDICRADFYDNKYGAFVTSFEAVRGACTKGTYTTTLDEEFIWTGVTNIPAYKTTKMVFRRITCANRVWQRGSEAIYDGQYVIPGARPRHSAMFTQDFWVSVFKVTQEQYYQLRGTYIGSYVDTDPIDHTRPLYGIKRATFRGAETDQPPTEDSFLGKLMALVEGRMVAEIPTDAEWEYVARAECDMGPDAGGGNMPNGTTEFTCIAHVSAANTSTASVGCYQPNAFGLYDVMGNGSEMVYDDYISYSDDDYLAQKNVDGVVVDPMGPHVGHGNVNVRGVGITVGNPGKGNRQACIFYRADNRTSGQGLFSARVKLTDVAP